MFRYERVNWTREFTIVAQIVSLLKRIYKRYAPFRAVFKVKTLAVLFPPYPRETKTNTAKFKSAAILSLAFFYRNGATHSHVRSIARAWLKHAHSFNRCGFTVAVLLKGNRSFLFDTVGDQLYLCRSPINTSLSTFVD